MKQFLLLITCIINLTAFSQNTDTEVKHRLDSIIEINYERHGKTAFFYDERENEILRIVYYWKSINSDKEWQELQRQEKTYYSNKNIKAETIENFNDPDLTGGHTGVKSESVYDTNGNITICIIFHRNKDNEWEEFKKEKTEYVYDTNGNITKKIFYNSERENECIKHKFEYTYDAYRNLKKVVSRTKKNVWMKHYKIKNTYDTFGNLIRIIVRYRIINVGKKEIIYDSNRNKIGEVSKNEKEEYTYDSNQNLIRLISYRRVNNTWKEIGRHEYIYDTLYSSENRIIPKNLYFNKYNNLLMEKRDYHLESDDWKVYSTTKYYYSPQTK